jgi:hypothetical protein
MRRRIHQSQLRSQSPGPKNSRAHPLLQPAADLGGGRIDIRLPPQPQGQAESLPLRFSQLPRNPLSEIAGVWEESLKFKFRVGDPTCCRRWDQRAKGHCRPPQKVEIFDGPGCQCLISRAVSMGRRNIISRSTSRSLKS